MLKKNPKTFLNCFITCSLLNIKCNQYDVLVNTEKHFSLSNELKNVVF